MGLIPFLVPCTNLTRYQNLTDAQQTARFHPEPNLIVAPSDGVSEPKSRALWHIMPPRGANDPITWDHLLDKPPSRCVHYPLGRTPTGRLGD